MKMVGVLGLLGPLPPAASVLGPGAHRLLANTVCSFTPSARQHRLLVTTSTTGY